MLIRSAQMAIFDAAAEQTFAQRLAGHLLEKYPEASVRLPDLESTVGALPAELLDRLVQVSIERARHYGLTFESSISAFSAIMFSAAPNFDNHNISNLCLTDEAVDPNDRLDEMLNLLTEDHWKRIRSDYDVAAWQTKAEESAIDAETTVETEPGQHDPDADFDAPDKDLDKTIKT